MSGLSSISASVALAAHSGSVTIFSDVGPQSRSVTIPALRAASRIFLQAYGFQMAGTLRTTRNGMRSTSDCPSCRLTLLITCFHNRLR